MEKEIERKKAPQGRKHIVIINSAPFSQILFLIANQKNYAQIISLERKTDPSSTFKQLENLKKLGFLLEPKKVPLLYKTVYEINWEKIIEEFFINLNKRRQQLQNKSQKDLQYPKELIVTFGLLDEKELIDKYRKNNYLISLFRETFKRGTSYEDLSINELFDWIIKIHPEEIIKKIDGKDEVISNNDTLQDYLILMKVCYELSSEFIEKDIIEVSKDILKDLIKS